MVNEIVAEMDPVVGERGLTTKYRDGKFTSAVLLRETFEEALADLAETRPGVLPALVALLRPQPRTLARVSLAELGVYTDQGQFAPGSMLPKVEAVIDYVMQTGGQALITNPPNLARALAGETGTWIEQ